ncbi:hypothetical [Yersinia pestis KIM10+]|uniref:Uncharacterized protein n=1 Tax=Yersinia pestis TaxID=632 RepID=Q8CKS3_YERPE|nr:hypothetical [Yersinia pestis KIM10+]
MLAIASITTEIKVNFAPLHYPARPQTVIPIPRSAHTPMTGGHTMELKVSDEPLIPPIQLMNMASTMLPQPVFQP